MSLHWGYSLDGNVTERKMTNEDRMTVGLQELHFALSGRPEW